MQSHAYLHHNNGPHPMPSLPEHGRARERDEWEVASPQMSKRVKVEQPEADGPPPPLCPCGAGHCRLLTAGPNSKNPGRKFFKCPNPQGEQCNFFQWADAASQGPPPATAPRHSPVKPPLQQQQQHNPYAWAEEDGFNAGQVLGLAQPASPPCPCGAGPCVMLTAGPNSKNPGRKFFKCPLPKASCFPSHCRRIPPPL